jgi:hypothetical protein
MIKTFYPFKDFREHGSIKKTLWCWRDSVSSCGDSGIVISIAGFPIFDLSIDSHRRYGYFIFLVLGIGFEINWR